jgi:uncharacterized membrane protein YdjX (TVP38/TMEM64 family)
MSPERHPWSIAGVRPRLLLKGMILIASLVILGWVLKVSGLGDLLDTHWVDAEVRGHGATGILIFLAVGSVVVAVGFFRQVVCFLAGYAFGFGAGVAWASLASLIGCMLCFVYARLLGRDLVVHKFGARVAKVDDFLRDHPLSMTVLIRFLPVGSNLLTNLIAGVSSVRPWPFFIGSLLGYLPQTIVFVLLGSGIHVHPALRISLSAVLFVVSTILGTTLYRRLRHGHTLGTEVDAAVEEGAPESAGNSR